MLARMATRRSGRSRSAWLGLAALLTLLPAPAAAQKPAAKDAAATTPEAKETLARVKTRLGDCWDYFAIPDCIVMFDFDPKKPETRTMNLGNAKTEAARLQQVLLRCRADLPPHDAMGRQVPILRLFANAASEQRYFGVETPTALQEKRAAAADAGEIVAQQPHAAWLFYVRQWFGPDVTPEPWFAAVGASRYGRLRPAGKSVAYDAPHFKTTSAQLAGVTFERAFAATRDEPAVTAFLAAFADLLERGPKVLGDRFDPTWARLLPAYASALRDKRPAEARKTAFADVDAGKLEQAIWSWAVQQQ